MTVVLQEVNREAKAGFRQEGHKAAAVEPHTAVEGICPDPGPRPASRVSSTGDPWSRRIT